ncbi:hypothetical protein L3Y34_012761 [Caenorhabditis briggsae]|uniref:Protein kinase domain-containing protein n=1 Tax=Caenorhabditis briggsae TaxID=6238 RepID=A0AAE8ZV97_CAEBR|nr:hypothetical protein L3Y34_012761 [Caenorhabditis briggsae]
MPQNEFVESDVEMMDIENSELEYHQTAERISKKTAMKMFEVLKTLGRGSMANVKLAVHKSECIVALKEITDKALRKIKEIYTRKVIFATPFNRSPFLVLEYLYMDLEALIYGGRTYKLEHIKTMCSHMLRGVDAMNGKGLVHLNLQPSHLMLSNNGIFKIADLSIATKIPANGKAPEIKEFGALHYRAPEILAGKVENLVKTDIWSVGCTLGELILRRKVFEGENEDVQLRLIQNGAFSYLFRITLSNPLLRGREAIEMAIRLMKVDHGERPSASEALRMEWFENNLQPDVSDLLKTYEGPRYKIAFD